LHARGTAQHQPGLASMGYATRAVPESRWPSGTRRLRALVAAMTKRPLLDVATGLAFILALAPPIARPPTAEPMVALRDHPPRAGGAGVAARHPSPRRARRARCRRPRAGGRPIAVAALSGAATRGRARPAAGGSAGSRLAGVPPLARRPRLRRTLRSASSRRR